VSSGLIVALFEKASPLHDGAACIERDRITWAGGILPVTGRIDLPAQYGTRHRAALGISEQTDAVALVLSEETGTYSLAKEGRITSRMDGAMLVERLREAMSNG
jgi:diadenylate cyclase